jgi:hypothetical protein
VMLLCSASRWLSVGCCFCCQGPPQTLQQNYPTFISSCTVCVKEEEKYVLLDSQRRKDPYVDTVLHVCPSSFFLTWKKTKLIFFFLRLWAVKFNPRLCYNLRARLSFANKAVIFHFLFLTNSILLNPKII